MRRYRRRRRRSLIRQCVVCDAMAWKFPSNSTLENGVRSDSAIHPTNKLWLVFAGGASNDKRTTEEGHEDKSLLLPGSVQSLKLEKRARERERERIGHSGGFRIATGRIRCRTGHAAMCAPPEDIKDKRRRKEKKRDQRKSF